MPIFQYKGYKTDGSEVAGTIEANSAKRCGITAQGIRIFIRKNVKEADLSETVAFIPKA